MLDYLKWCFVAEMFENMDPKALQQALVMEGLHRVKATVMGERLMLLHLDGTGDIEAVRSNHQQWWDSMFKSVKSWNPKLVAESRVVWIEVPGVPPHVWDGVFIDFDEDTIERKRLDVARVQVSTMRRGFIDEVLSIKVMGALFKLWVVEEGGGRRLPQD
jgi:hypothetical protein